MSRTSGRWWDPTSIRAWATTTRRGKERATAPRPSSIVTSAASSRSPPRSITRFHISCCSRPSGLNGYTKNAGNYWVFEGLGTYFETVTPQPDGSLEVGGFVGERILAARQSLADGKFLPLDQFLLLDQNAFNREQSIHAHYQQAMALTVFLMQWKDETYREAFLDYVRDAYRGRIKLRTGRSLEDRLGEPVRMLDTQFREFARQGRCRLIAGQQVSASNLRRPGFATWIPSEAELEVTAPARGRLTRRRRAGGP